MESVLETALQNAPSLPPGVRIGVAVSGGADSIALLTAMHALSRWQLTALHVNHNLRGPESDADEHFVRTHAQSLGIPFLLRPAGSLIAGLSHNQEAQARQTRYTWFHHLLTQNLFDLIVTAHTASDQAETVLFRFLRGSGTAGLAAILPSTNRIVRPFLHLTRNQIRHYLQTHAIPWREDFSNSNLSFARNRIRHELLPTLTRDWNPALPALLTQTAEWARAEEEYWAAETPRLSATCALFKNNAAILTILKLIALPLAAARRVLRFVISIVKGDLLAIDFSHIERILTLATAPTGHGSLQIPGLHVHRSFDWIRLSRPEPPPPPFSYPLHVPGAFPLMHTATTLQLELKTADSVYNIDGHRLDWGLLSGSLVLRSWLPGDCYKQAGHSSAIKLKHLFQKIRIPSWERHRWPVITLDNSIVWARDFGPAAGFAPSVETCVVLVVSEKENRIV